MTREEFRLKVRESQNWLHSMKRRSSWHNYDCKGTYMLTLVVSDRKRLLGKLVASDETKNFPHVMPSPLGEAILHKEVMKIHLFYPQIDVWKVCLMPDHLHMIVRVREDLPIGKHLGKVIAGFKIGCNRAYWRIFNVNEPPRKGLFEDGYNDKILQHEGQLENWRRYLDDNPRRLLMKIQKPELFTVVTDFSIGEERCQIVGNRFLLDIPDKEAVIVHRRYSDEEVNRLQQQWFDCGERGGVLVSAAISPKEKAVLREAFNRGYRIILLRENGFPSLYKPTGDSFNACSEGLLLEISPWDYHMEKKVITREQCLMLNTLAEKIAKGY